MDTQTRCRPTPDCTRSQSQSSQYLWLYTPTLGCQTWPQKRPDPDGKKIDVHSLNQNGDSPVDMAIHFGQDEVIHLLLGTTKRLK